MNITIFVFALMLLSIASAKKDPFVKSNGEEHEIDLTEEDIEEADKMEPLTAKKLKELGIDVPKQPTLGEEEEGDLLNMPRATKKGKSKRNVQTENREIQLSRVKRNDQSYLENVLNKLQNRKMRLSRVKRKIDPSEHQHELTTIQMNVSGVNYRRYTFGKGATEFNYVIWAWGEIPYKLSSRYEPWAKQDIAKAMLEIEDRTAIGEKKCIKFIDYAKIPLKIKNNANDKHRLDHFIYHYGNVDDHLYVRPSKSCAEKGNCCSSSAGKVELIGKQRLLLDHSCMGFGTILHELLHALGLLHEQSRADRDKYVTIIKENIIEGRESQFVRHPWYPIPVKGTNNAPGIPDFDLPSKQFSAPLTEYDFDSVMHYPADAFLKENAKGNYTIVPKDKKLANNATFMSNLGYNEHLSVNDVEQLRHLYKCYFKKN